MEKPCLKKGARTQQQLRTGLSLESNPQMTMDSLHQKPRFARWSIYAAAVLIVTGVLPTVAVAAVGFIVDALGTWVLALLLAAVAAFVAWALSW